MQFCNRFDKRNAHSVSHRKRNCRVEERPISRIGKGIGTTEVIALTPQQKYDKVNTKFIGLKLNRKTDHDILSVLEGKPKQTEIKRLVRLGLAAEQKDAEKEQG